MIFTDREGYVSAPALCNAIEITPAPTDKLRNCRRRSFIFSSPCCIRAALGDPASIVKCIECGKTPQYLTRTAMKGPRLPKGVMNVVFGPLPAMSASPSRAAVEADLAISRNVPLTSFPIIRQPGASRHRRTAAPADWFGMVEIEARRD